MTETSMDIVERLRALVRSDDMSISDEADILEAADHIEALTKAPEGLDLPMRRSYVEGSANGNGDPLFKPDPNGPYVLWDDARAYIARLTALLNAERERADAAEIKWRAALILAANSDEDAIEAEAACERAEAALREVHQWAVSRCPCENGQPNPCPLCGADANDICLSAENTLPRTLLATINAALSKPEEQP